MAITIKSISWKPKCFPNCLKSHCRKDVTTDWNGRRKQSEVHDAFPFYKQSQMSSTLSNTQVYLSISGSFLFGFISCPILNVLFIAIVGHYFLLHLLLLCFLYFLFSAIYSFPVLLNKNLKNIFFCVSLLKILSDIRHKMVYPDKYYGVRGQRIRYWRSSSAMYRLWGWSELHDILFLKKWNKKLVAWTLLLGFSSLFFLNSYVSSCEAQTSFFKYVFSFILENFIFIWRNIWSYLLLISLLWILHFFHNMTSSQLHAFWFLFMDNQLSPIGVSGTCIGVGTPTREWEPHQWTYLQERMSVPPKPPVIISFG